MVILGVWDGTPSSAALLVDGELVCAISEERITRVKNSYGFPQNAINTVLESANLTINDVDRVAMSTKSLLPMYFYTNRNSSFSIRDYWREQREYWYPKFYENKDPQYLDVFSDKIDLSNFPYDQKLIHNERDHEGMWKARLEHICRRLGLHNEQVSVHDHHLCHAYYAFFLSPYRDEVSLVYTMDGNGDNTNGTVSVSKSHSELEVISRSSNCNIGRMYRYATLLLGMRPADHEYKLMGLAAYNKEEFGKRAYEIYAETLEVNGLEFRYKKKIEDHFFYFKKALEGERFDAIAYGIQKFTEEILTKWIANGVKETGITNLVMSGGVAQNIKANKLICELSGITQLFVPPGPGDESISIGAAFVEALDTEKLVCPTRQAESGFFGPSYSEKDFSKAIKEHNCVNWSASKVTDAEVADILAKGNVIARFGEGRAEFGARALGGRSIIADPRRPDAINHINKLVKMRDFWMPFAPSVLEERESDYIQNKKGIDARFMAIGFDTTSLAHDHLRAGLHPFDKTARPQVVRKKENPNYYSLIKAFENITGVGAVLNTSFNIHGEPIVGSPHDAISTFERCGLDYLLLGNWLLKKNN